MGHTTWAPHIANDDQLINWFKKWMGSLKIKFHIGWHCTQVEFNQIQQNSIVFQFNYIQLKRNMMQIGVEGVENMFKYGVGVFFEKEANLKRHISIYLYLGMG